MIETDEYFVWTKGAAHQFSAHFASREFECQCAYDTCRTQRIAKALVEKLERVRVAVGKPITVTSGFRCNKHQADLVSGGKVETVQHSTHELGRAADIKCRLMTPLFDECKKEFMAIGMARNFLHVDLRDGRVRRWTYK